jgi:N-hydroxyarylamine O-acetyltransferase
MLVGDVFDFDIYLRRIGLSRASIRAHAQHSFSLMHAIAWGQATHIPFENLATLYPSMRVVALGDEPKDPVAALARQQRSQLRNSLDPTDIYQKLVLSHRGGFCFEQNLLLARALRETGLRVDLVAARGVNRGGDATSDGFALSCFTHLVLITVAHDGKRYLVDNGYGWAGAPRQPLELVDGRVVEDPRTGEVFRLVRGDVSPSLAEGATLWGCHRFRVGHGGARKKSGAPDSRGWFLQYKSGAQAADYWDVYHFGVDGYVSAMDCESGAWYASTNPYHRQTQIKLVALMTSDGRISLVDNALTLRRAGKVALEKAISNDEHELRGVMREYFDIEFVP